MSIKEKLERLTSNWDGIDEANYPITLRLSDEKMKGLYKKMTPRAKNFKEIQKAIEPYDDHDQLKQQPAIDRMEVLR